MQRSDNEIVELILAGETQLFEILVARYQKPIANFVYQIIHHYEEAVDLAQDIFIKVYLALDRFDGKYKFSTWIFRIAQNAAIDYARKRRLKLVSISGAGEPGEEGYQMDFPSADPTPLGVVKNKELKIAIDEAIAALPAEYKDLIVLRHFGCLSYEEIAELKEIPLGTVKNRLFRGRALLKERLKDYVE